MIIKKYMKDKEEEFFEDIVIVGLLITLCFIIVWLIGGIFLLFDSSFGRIGAILNLLLIVFMSALASIMEKNNL